MLTALSLRCYNPVSVKTLIIKGKNIMAKILKPLAKKGASNVTTTTTKGSKPALKPITGKSTSVKAPVKPVQSKVAPVKLPSKAASRPATKPAAKIITKPAAAILPIKKPAAKPVPAIVADDTPAILRIKPIKTQDGKVSGIYKHSQTGNFQMRYPELGVHIATLATEELAIEHQRKLILLVKKHYENQRHLFDNDIEYIKAIYAKYLRIKRVAVPKAETAKVEANAPQVKKVSAPIAKGNAAKPSLKPLSKPTGKPALKPLSKPTGKKTKNTDNDL